MITLTTAQVDTINKQLPHESAFQLREVAGIPKLYDAWNNHNPCQKNIKNLIRIRNLIADEYRIMSSIIYYKGVMYLSCSDLDYEQKIIQSYFLYLYKNHYKYSMNTMSIRSNDSKRDVMIYTGCGYNWAMRIDNENRRTCITASSLFGLPMKATNTDFIFNYESPRIEKQSDMFMGIIAKIPLFIDNCITMDDMLSTCKESIA